MRKLGHIALALVTAGLGLAGPVVHAQDVRTIPADSIFGPPHRPLPATAKSTEYPTAQKAYGNLTTTEKATLAFTLVASGFYDGPVPQDMTKPLFEGIQAFQSAHGLSRTGVPDDGTREELEATGGITLGSLGMAFIDHPSANASLWVPTHVLVNRQSLPNGYAWSSQDNGLSLEFTFRRTSLPGAYSDVLKDATRVDMRMSRPDVVAVSGRTMGGKELYARYIRVNGGVAGFELTWNRDERPEGKDLSILMANGLTGARRARADAVSP